MHLDINNTFLIDFDPFQITLTFIFVAIANVIRYPYHTQQAWNVGFLGGEDKVATKIYVINTAPELLT